MKILIKIENVPDLPYTLEGRVFFDQNLNLRQVNIFDHKIKDYFFAVIDEKENWKKTESIVTLEIKIKTEFNEYINIFDITPRIKGELNTLTAEQTLLYSKIGAQNTQKK